MPHNRVKCFGGSSGCFVKELFWRSGEEGEIFRGPNAGAGECLGVLGQGLFSRFSSGHVC